MKNKGFIILALLTYVLVGGWALDGLKINDVKANTPQYGEMASLVLTNEKVKVEVNSQFNPMDLVVSGSFDKIEVPIVDTTILGEQKITYQVTKDLSNIKVSKTIQVVDTQAPSFIESIDNLTLDYGEDVALEDYFKAVDAVDGDLKVSFSKSIDSTIAGNVNLTASVTDNSGNTTTHDFVVEVLPKPTPTSLVGSVVSYSPNTYGAGWCTWWVAEQRASIGAPIPNNWGHALTWYQGALNAGYATGTEPAVGAIAYFPGANHVAFVEAVYDNGTILISEMGWYWTAFNYNSRVISAANALYIY